MPNMKNAKKAVKVIAKREDSNNIFKASVKSAMKMVEKAVSAKDKDKAPSLIPLTAPAPFVLDVDKM